MKKVDHTMRCLALSRLVLLNAMPGDAMSCHVFLVLSCLTLPCHTVPCKHHAAML